MTSLDRQAKALPERKEFSKRALENWLYKTLGDKFHDGTPNPPGSMQELEFGKPEHGNSPYIISFRPNEGHEIWMGYTDDWEFFFPSQYAPRVAWFLFWTWWVKATWFGLRRKVWYKLLHRQVSRNRRMGWLWRAVDK